MKKLLGNKKIRVILVAAGIILIAAAVVLFLLKDRLFPPKEEVIPEPEPIEAPVQYALGDVKFLALPAGNAALVYDEEADSLKAQAEAIMAEAAQEATGEKQPENEPEQPEDADSEEAAPAEEPAPAEEENAPVTLAAYRYEGMANAPQQVSAYVALLTTEDMGFLHADNTLKDLEDEPVFWSMMGSTYLIYRLPEPEENEETGEKPEHQAIALRIEWERTACTVTAELIPESMTHRPKPPAAAMAGGGTTLTFSTAVDQIKAMHPSTLELKGESMDDYRVYSRDGLALIDGQSCMRMDIYKIDERTGTNKVSGNYFLSADGLHLYRLNTETQTVRELPMH